uniref:Uncharacterized protein n=1 Tax=Rhizophora mucronata TaxID=61149 RepID=A0A2P2NKH7_RHIMU
MGKFEKICDFNICEVIGPRLSSFLSHRLVGVRETPIPSCRCVADWKDKLDSLMGGILEVDYISKASVC